MRKFLMLLGTALCMSIMAVIPSAAGPCSPHHDEPPGVYVPPEGCFAVGVGYEYQHFNVLGTSFHNNGLNVNVTMHLFDFITGASGRLTVGIEGATDLGYAGNTGGLMPLNVRSLFAGGGPHLAIPNRSRFEPWAHGLVGWERFRFTQTATLGTNSAFGFRVGVGLDIRLAPRAYWRVEGDYVGTNFQSSIQSNYGAGTGIVLYF